MNGESLSDLDELKLAWQALEGRLERQHALELASFRRARLLDVRRALRPFVAGQLAQALLGALMVVWFAVYWVEHRGTPALLPMGVVGQLWATALVGLAVFELVAVQQLDYAAPVVALQKRIAELRARRVRRLMWIPVTLVVFRQLGGAQRWAEQPEIVAWFAWAERPEVLIWLAANVVAVPALLALLLRWLRDPKRARWPGASKTSSRAAASCARSRCSRRSRTPSASDHARRGPPSRILRACSSPNAATPPPKSWPP